MLEINEKGDAEFDPRLGFWLGKGKGDEENVGGGEDQEDLDDDFDDYEDDLEEDYDEEEVSEEVHPLNRHRLGQFIGAGEIFLKQLAL